MISIYIWCLYLMPWVSGEIETLVRVPLKSNSEIQKQSPHLILQKELFEQIQLDYRNFLSEKNTRNSSFQFEDEDYLKRCLQELEENYNEAKSLHRFIIFKNNCDSECQNYMKEKMFDQIRLIFFAYYKGLEHEINMSKSKSKHRVIKAKHSDDYDTEIEEIETKKTNQCRIGFTGNGVECDVDTDFDNWPDIQLNCLNKYCKKDNCMYVPNFDQKDSDSDGIGDACDNCPKTSNFDQRDSDLDGVGDACDNCANKSNKDQKDTDGDDIGDVCDNCPKISNFDQKNSDSDEFGDACDNCPDIYNADQIDSDFDNIGDKCDNCPSERNPDQTDTDFDEIGDACDNCPNSSNFDQEDSDSDGVGDVCDNCISKSNEDQRDTDSDKVGDACDNCFKISNFDQEDSDLDEIGDVCDNCPNESNEDQKDTDGDKIGDACDNCAKLFTNSSEIDSDKDGVGNACDNCPDISNFDQKDSDYDTIGDECDNCPFERNLDQNDIDGDNIGDVCDNCPNIPNFDQKDFDRDHIGDVCDNCLYDFNYSQKDSDNDTIGDACDNCSKKNPNQSDKDDDFVGDECDTDIDYDKDGVQDNLDNCKDIPNANQLDSNSNGRGNACDLHHKNITCVTTDPKRNMNNLRIIYLDPSYQSKIENSSKWTEYQDGTEILHNNLEYNLSVAIKKERFSSLEFEGTFQFNPQVKFKGYAGVVFSYQSNKRFYVLMWKIGDTYIDVQMKRIFSSSGPGRSLAISLNKAQTTRDQIDVFWKQMTKVPSYEINELQWYLVHRPQKGTISFKLSENHRVLVEANNIPEGTLKGGHIGFYGYHSNNVTWKNFSYRCIDD